MTVTGKQKRFFAAFIFIIAVCLLLIIFYSGFQYERKKFMAMLVTMFLVLIYGFLIGDLIWFVCCALYATYFKKRDASHSNSWIQEIKHTCIDLLMLRIASLRANSKLTDKHRHEYTNTRYRAITTELWLFLRYFVLLLLLVVYTRHPLAYYNTNVVYKILHDPIAGHRGIQEVRSISNLYDFIEHTLVDSFGVTNDNDGQTITPPGWMPLTVGKLLGVMRLRQVRYTSKEAAAFPESDFSQQRYLPDWQPFWPYHYFDKYWRTFGPWLPYMNTDLGSGLFSSTQYGELHTYTEGHGYVTLLTRDYNNSIEIVQFLKQHNWLDNRTLALFIDFTLFNVDSNMFSVCSLLLEQTPFGSMVSQLNVQSCELLNNLEHLSLLGLFMLMLYLLQLIQFIQVWALKVWHTPKMALSGWNLLDGLIILLNGFVLYLRYEKEARVSALLENLNEVPKSVFLDFRIPAQLDYLVLVFTGLLVCLTTIRIWKILQFASVFRMFTRTLHIAKWAIWSNTLIIVIFICSFGLSACLINGANSAIFRNFIQSVMATMSIAFGFASNISPKDLSYGGDMIGFLLYAILLVVVAIILINISITLVIDYFGKAKQLEQERAVELGFLQFLGVEYAPIWKCCQSICCKRKHHTVCMQMEDALDKLESEQELKTLPKAEQQLKQQLQDLDNEEQEELLLRVRVKRAALVMQNHNEHLNHLTILSEVLVTQMQLLERELTLLDIEYDSEDEKQSPRKAAKNGKSDEVWHKGRTVPMKWQLAGLQFYYKKWIIKFGLFVLNS